MMNRTQCLNTIGSDYIIRKKVKNGELFRVGKSVYSDKSHIPELAVLSFKYPKAVVTMHTAFYLHGLTDVIPDIYDFATLRDAAKIKDKTIKQYFIPEELFEHGIEETDHHGYPIKIYSKERMLIELLRYKTKLPYDYYKEVLLNYRRIIPDLDIRNIEDYAMYSPKSGKIMEMLQTEVL